MTRIHINDESGFTLVELMIVVGIIGLLASMAIPNMQKMSEKSRDSEAHTILASIYATEQVVRSEFGGFTSALGEFGYQPEGLNHDKNGASTGVYKGYFTHGFKNEACASPNDQVASRKVAALDIECNPPAKGAVTANHFLSDHGYNGRQPVADKVLVDTFVKNDEFTAAAGTVDSSVPANKYKIWTINDQKVSNLLIK